MRTDDVAMEETGMNAAGTNDTGTQEWTRIGSPIGELLLTRSERGLTGVYMGRHIDPGTDPGVDGGWERDDAAFADVRRQLDAYFAGELREFDLELSPVGTPFQLSVWAALRTIPYGQTRSYGAIAAQIGSPKGARAVGLANGRNPVSIVVPCHRVIGSSGTLTGYAGGLERKRYLLDLERDRLSGAAQLR